MKYISVIGLIFLFWGCKPTQTVDVKIEKGVEETCKTVGTVKDFSGLDGCKFLIVLENGKRLEPVVIEDEDFQLRDGQKIKFDYQQETEVMSICMGGRTVRITCIKEL